MTTKSTHTKPVSGPKAGKAISRKAIMKSAGTNATVSEFKSANRKSKAKVGAKTNVNRVGVHVIIKGAVAGGNVTTVKVPGVTIGRLRNIATSPQALIDQMREGEIAREAIKRVSHTLGIAQDRLFVDLSLPRSTLKARMSSGARLAPLEQDRIYRTEAVYARALAVLGDEESARQWMQRTHRSVGGVTPMSLLDTQAGYDLVIDTLSRIEHGVVS